MQILKSIKPIRFGQESSSKPTRFAPLLEQAIEEGRLSQTSGDSLKKGLVNVDVKEAMEEAIRLRDMGRLNKNQQLIPGVSFCL
ncbi:MAG: hypothetical protein VKJ06_08855 [Vampirovibrionales bacterium]|nr:hypothetical protein [Vampirovibrionales bacterium]